MEDRLFVDVADLQAVRFECPKCRAVLTVSAATFKALPMHCPGCAQQWFLEGDATQKTVDHLMHSLRELAAMAERGPFRVGFDLPGPK